MAFDERKDPEVDIVFQIYECFFANPNRPFKHWIRFNADHSYTARHGKKFHQLLIKCGVK